MCTVPDLISVLDQDGSALETHELRYGLLVQVIAMPAHPLWKTEQGMKAGGPDAFKYVKIHLLAYAMLSRGIC